MPPAPGIQTGKKIVYVVERRTQPKTTGGNDKKERENSFLTEAFTSKNQAYRVAIREQISWLQQHQPGLAQTAAQINARKGMSLDHRLDQIQVKFEEAPQLTVQKWDVKEFRLSEDSDHSSDEEEEEEEEDEDELDELEEEEEEEEGEEEEEDQEETEDDEDGDGDEDDDDDDDDDEEKPPAKRPRQ